MQELRKLPDQTTHQQSLQPLHLELQDPDNGSLHVHGYYKSVQLKEI